MAHWTENAASYEKTLRNAFIWLEYLQLDPECKQLIRLAFKDDEAGMIRYQEVILGIERRWDRLMRYREWRSHRVRQWDRHGNLVKSEYFDKY